MNLIDKYDDDNDDQDNDDQDGQQFNDDDHHHDKGVTITITTGKVSNIIIGF